MNYFKRLRARHWAWASVLAVAAVWWPLFIISTPPDFIQTSIDPGILIFCMVVATVGGVIKILGYLASQLSGRVGVIGVSVELAGLCLSAVGPAAYLVISLYGIWAPDVSVEINSGFILAVAVLTMYLYRAIIIIPRFIFEAHDEAKDD
jgi:hypothetical protein